MRRYFRYRSSKSRSAGRPPSRDSAFVDRGQHARHDGARIAVRAAQRLGHDLVDDAESLQILRREFQPRRRLLGLARIRPQNRRAALRRRDRVRAVLEHDDVIGDGQRQRPARAAFADDGGDDRNARLRELVETTRDRFGLRVLFRRYPRIGAFGVDERHDRQSQARRQVC